VTEVGRQPWIVYKLLTVDQAVSKSVSSGWVLVSLIGFILIYSFTSVITIGLMIKTAKKEA
jgi:cytochrome d ubiquinol oxidase subunit I